MLEWLICFICFHDNEISWPPECPEGPGFTEYCLLYTVKAQNKRPLASPASLPERSGMWIACFNIRMKIVLNVKVSRTVRMGADQDSAKVKSKPCQSQTMMHSCCSFRFNGRHLKTIKVETVWISGEGSQPSRSWFKRFIQTSTSSC